MADVPEAVPGQESFSDSGYGNVYSRDDKTYLRKIGERGLRTFSSDDAQKVLTDSTLYERVSPQEVYEVDRTRKNREFAKQDSLHEIKTVAEAAGRSAIDMVTLGARLGIMPGLPMGITPDMLGLEILTGGEVLEGLGISDPELSRKRVEASPGLAGLGRALPDLAMMALTGGTGAIAKAALGQVAKKGGTTFLRGLAKPIMINAGVSGATNAGVETERAWRTSTPVDRARLFSRFTAGAFVGAALGTGVGLVGKGVSKVGSMLQRGVFGKIDNVALRAAGAEVKTAQAAVATARGAKDEAVSAAQKTAFAGRAPDVARAEAAAIKRGAQDAAPKHSGEFRPQQRGLFDDPVPERRPFRDTSGQESLPFDPKYSAQGAAQFKRGGEQVGVPRGVAAETERVVEAAGKKAGTKADKVIGKAEKELVGVEKSAARAVQPAGGAVGAAGKGLSFAKKAARVFGRSALSGSRTQQVARLIENIPTEGLRAAGAGAGAGAQRLIQGAGSLAQRQAATYGRAPLIVEMDRHAVDKEFSDGYLELAMGADLAARNIMGAVEHAADPSAEWEPVSGVGDYENFPHGQFRDAPEQSRRDAFFARTRNIAELANNPEQLIGNLSENTETLGQYSPELSRDAIQTSLAAVNFMERFGRASKSIPDPLQPTQTEGVVDEVSMRSYEDLWNASMFPAVILDELANWDIKEETILALSTVHPSYLQDVRNHVQDKLLSGAWKPTYQQRIQLGPLLGLAEQTASPQFQSRLNQYVQMAAQAQAADGQGGGRKSGSAGRPGVNRGNPTFAQQNQTLSQRASESIGN